MSKERILLVASSSIGAASRNVKLISGALLEDLQAGVTLRKVCRANVGRDAITTAGAGRCVDTVAVRRVKQLAATRVLGFHVAAHKDVPRPASSDVFLSACFRNALRKPLVLLDAEKAGIKLPVAITAQDTTVEPSASTLLPQANTRVVGAVRHRDHVFHLSLQAHERSV